MAGQTGNAHRRRTKSLHTSYTWRATNCRRHTVQDEQDEIGFLVVALSAMTTLITVFILKTLEVL